MLRFILSLLGFCSTNAPTIKRHDVSAFSSEKRMFYFLFKGNGHGENYKY